MTLTERLQEEHQFMKKVLLKIAEPGCSCERWMIQSKVKCDSCIAADALKKVKL